MTTATTPTTLSLDEALHVLFPTPGLGLLRLEAGDVHSQFFRRLTNGEWVALDENYGSPGWSGPLLFVSRHPGSTIRFNPVLFRGTALGASWPQAVVWTTIRVALAAQHVSALQPRRNAQSAKAARERLQGAVLPPGLVID